MHVWSTLYIVNTFESTSRMFTLLQKTKLKTVQLNVSKGYCGSESYAVLDDLNIDVRDGEFVNMEHCRNGD